MIPHPTKPEVDPKTLEAEVILLRRKLKALEDRVEDLEGS